ncbi:hypothetical protein V8E55_009676 [Tylopilus felleus]
MWSSDEESTSLALAEHYFGPLLSPVAATAAQWTTYTERRLGTRAEYGNVFDRRKRSISIPVAAVEKELGLDDGTLQRCISIVSRSVELDDIDVPSQCRYLVRIYSPATPKYIDVHVKYHYRSRMYSIEWCYSIGYKIRNRITGSCATDEGPSMLGPVSLWHSRGGWQSICWGYFDDDGHYGRGWRRIEVADMGLHEQGVLDVHEALFGPIETPPDEDVEALLAYRRKLVATCRLLLAALGINYEVACTDEEQDDRPGDFMLEGLGDKWVARGIRAACGFQLSGDPEAAKRGQEEREEAMYEDDEEDRFSDDGWF